MTVIAAFRVHDIPIIIGDTLVSTEKPKRTIRLPGSGQNSSEVAECDYPSRLKQKVNVINDNLIIAWAGDYEIAGKFVKELKTAMSSIPSPSREYVKGIMDKFDEENLRCDAGADFAYVFLYKEGEKTRPLIGSHNAQELQLEGYEELVVAGSGWAALIDSLKGFDVKFTTGKLSNGIQAAHAVITRLWKLDITSQVNIRHHAFGGGYEIGTDLGNRLGKVGDILLAAFEVRDTSGLGQNRRLAKQDYLDDYLILRVQDFQGNPPQHQEGPDAVVTFKNEDVKRRNFIITPVDVDDRLVKIKDLRLERLPDWNAEYTAVQLDVFAKNGKYIEFESTRTYWRPRRDGPIRFENPGFYCIPEFVNEIKKLAVAHLRQRR